MRGFVSGLRVVVLAAVALLLAVPAERSLSTEFSLATDGDVARAVVLSDEIVRGPLRRIEVRFTALRRGPVTTTYRQFGSGAGPEVLVRYVRSDPTTARAAGSRWELAAGTATGLGALLFGLAALRAARPRRRLQARRAAARSGQPTGRTSGP